MKVSLHAKFCTHILTYSERPQFNESMLYSFLNEKIDGKLIRPGLKESFDDEEEQGKKPRKRKRRARRPNRQRQRKGARQGSAKRVAQQQNINSMSIHNIFETANRVTEILSQQPTLADSEENVEASTGPSKGGKVIDFESLVKALTNNN